jgi:TonB-dependent SusC/RagA subfamily outer membrane receptor
MTPASPSTVERDEMEDAPSSIEDLIRGRFPNVYIERNGSRLTLRIRGVSTFSGGTNALVVIDGVAHDTPDVLLDVNPADVVRIQVLKDAAAAIYGVRGQNGVLVVTTRRTG